MMICFSIEVLWWQNAIVAIFWSEYYSFLCRGTHQQPLHQEPTTRLACLSIQDWTPGLEAILLLLVSCEVVCFITVSMKERPIKVLRRFRVFPEHFWQYSLTFFVKIFLLLDMRRQMCYENGLEFAFFQYILRKVSVFIFSDQ